MAALARFLNLDVVLKSNSGLGALVKHLDQRVFVLSDQEFERQFVLVLELTGKPRQHDGRLTFADFGYRWVTGLEREFHFGADFGSHRECRTTHALLESQQGPLIVQRARYVGGGSSSEAQEG